MGGRLIEEAKSWQQVDSTHILLLTKIAKDEDQESPVRRVGLIWWWWLEEGIIDAFACTCMQLPPLFHPVGSLAVVLLIVLLMSFSWSFQATTSAIHWPPYFGPLVISSFFLSYSRIFLLILLSNFSPFLCCRLRLCCRLLLKSQFTRRSPPT